MKSELSKFPTEFIERLKRILPPGLQSQSWQGLTSPKPTVFRINSLKSSEEAVLKDLGFWDLQCEPFRDFPHAYELKKGSHKKLSETQSFKEGWIYLQGLTSQLPPLVLDPQPGERVLDMAAAPGGKTTYIAALMKNEGEIVALEPDPIRFERMSFNIERQGAKVLPLNIKGEKLDSKYSEYFDRVLLDAPCSSEGTFLAHDRKGYSHWSVSFVQNISALQKKLLAAAVGYLKPGGRLVYSTCSLSPEENEAVVDWALTQFPQLTALDFQLKHSYLKPGLPSWNGQPFKPGVLKSRRVYPSPSMEGFYLASFKKTA